MAPLEHQPDIEKSIWHMEMDIADPEFYIFSDGSALKMYNQHTFKQFTIIGTSDSQSYREGGQTDALFNPISGFTQVNETHILVVDQNNNCLRYVDRRTNSSSQFAGTCGASGNQDGEQFDALFNSPRQIILKDQSTAHVTDFENRAIRQVDIVTGQVTTWLALDDRPIGIIRNQPKQVYFVSTESRILRIRLDSVVAYSVIPSTVPGFRDGQFRSARFDHPTSIVELGRDTLIVAEPKSNRLRVLHLKERRVTSICTGRSGFTDEAAVGRCELESPQSLLLIRREAIIVIGANATELRVLGFDRGK